MPLPPHTTSCLVSGSRFSIWPRGLLNPGATQGQGQAGARAHGQRQGACEAAACCWVPIRSTAVPPGVTEPSEALAISREEGRGWREKVPR